VPETDEPPVATATTLRRLAVAAVACTIILTAAAFWLSYAHLHTVAHNNGLGGVRAWAWPATVDLFIVIGEILLLIASLSRRVDAAAIGLTVIGSGGSIALNVAGVGSDASIMTYVVAAVPPVAALLAFGTLMRQFHNALQRTAPGANATAPLAPEDAVPAAKTIPDPVGSPAPIGGTSVDSSPPPVGDKVDLTKRQKTPDPVDSDDRQLPPASRQRAPRPAAKKPGKSTRRSMDEWVEVAAPVFHAEFARLRRQPTASEFAAAISKAKLGSPSESTAKNIRTEILDRTDLPQLS
jgi:hypothetical protein